MISDSLLSSTSINVSEESFLLLLRVPINVDHDFLGQFHNSFE